MLHGYKALRFRSLTSIFTKVTGCPTTQAIMQLTRVSGQQTRAIVYVAPLFLTCVLLLLLYSPWASVLFFSSPSPEILPSKIPRKLWYKLGPNGLNDDTREWTNSCIRSNKGYEVEFMTESSADAFVRNAFGVAYPELVEIYLGLTGSCFP